MGYVPAPEQNNTVIPPERPEYVSSGTSETFPEIVSDAAEAYNDTNPEIPEQTASAEPEIPVPEPFYSEKTPETETISQQTAASETFRAGVDPYPIPGTIPKSGGSYSGMKSVPIPDTIVNIPAESPASNPDRKCRYTLGHIMLCLASTAIMAIIAGIFAGLYFSVV